MKIKEKIMLDRPGLYQHGPINVVIFGDSVSHGALTDNIEYETVYWNLLRKKLNKFRSFIPVNMINAAICGTTAKLSLSRLERQVFIHEPDLIIVCFGLNDVNGTLEDYLSSLESIFKKCIEADYDVIFMTPNMLNTYVAPDTAEDLVSCAAETAEMQNSGKMDSYMASAVNLANELGVTVCDCYSKWKELSKTQDTTMLLANRINHPNPEMHSLFADSLYDIIMADTQNSKENESTMFQKQ